MGFYIKPLKNKKKPPFWKVQFISYKKDSTNGQSLKHGKTRDLDKQEWLHHGFNPNMNLFEAQTRQKQLNAQAEIKRTQEKRLNIKKRLEEEDKKLYANLPELFVLEFEKRILFGRLSRGNTEHQKKNKIESHWRAARKTLLSLQLEPSEWEESRLDFYNYFSSKGFSLSYVQKLLRILNQWGLFLSKKQGKYFSPIPAPTGNDRNFIAEAYFNKSPTGRGRESDSLTPELLKAVKGKIKEDNFNWLHLSVYLGLRPKEIDGLKNIKNWKLEIDDNNIKILWIYQSKLSSLSKDKRWKPIPLIYNEQIETEEIIKNLNFRRPINKVMRYYFGDQITLYGGRKGFTDLMLSRGQSLEDISHWLGHTTIDRTWKNYKNKNIVRYKKVSAN